MCVAILILALVGYPYFSATSYFKVGSCCSIQVSFDSHPAAPEMYRNSTWLPGMRWDSMILFPIWMFVNLWTSKTPTGEVLFFCQQMTHHFDVICIYPAMYVLMITKILHQLRPGRQYTLLFSYRVLYMPDPRCYKLSAKMECSCVIYCNTDFAWIFVAQVLAIAFV